MGLVPPRFSYWTILIDGKPTAFRAAEQEELQPTLAQLRRANPVIEMKWFARGKLWDSPEQAQWAGRNANDLRKAGPPRDREWRPGGEHKDPRARFDKHKKKGRPRNDRPRERDRDRPPALAKPNSIDPTRPPENTRLPEGKRPWADKPPGGFRRDKPGGPPRGGRPWSGKPPGAGGFRREERNDRPRQDKPAFDAPKGDRPWRDEAGPPRGGRPWSGKPSGAPKGDRPWRDKPSGPPRGDRPWSGKPPGAGGFRRDERGDRPRQDKPAFGPPKGDRPWRDKPAGPPRGDRPWSGKPSASAKLRRDESGGDRSGPSKPRDRGLASPKDGAARPPERPKPRGGRPFPPKRGGR